MNGNLSKARNALAMSELTPPGERPELYTYAAALAQIAQAEILEEIAEALRHPQPAPARHMTHSIDTF